MKVTEILSMIHAPKGLTSVIAGIAQNDFSVIPHQKGLNASLEIADEKIKLHEKQIAECTSDWAYWSILGDLEYWKAVRNILKAAELVGEDNMPEVEFKNDGGVAMDAIYNVKKFGELVLKLATEQSSKNESR